MRFVGAILFFVSSVVWFLGCASMNRTTSQIPKPAIPEFVMQPLHSQKVHKAKVYTHADGSFRKFSIYVDATSLPAWVITIADEKIGKGEPKSCEIEQYQDGTKVYEVTRIIDGKAVEIAIKEDRTVHYLEKQLFEEELPATIKAAIAKLTGFVFQEAEVKEISNAKLYEIEGTMGDAWWSFEIDEKGEIKRRTLLLPAKLAVDQIVGQDEDR